MVTPAQYLPTPPAAARYLRALNRVERFFAKGREAKRTTLSSLDLRLAWDDVPLDRLRKLLRPFVIADGIEDHFSGRIELYRCRDGEGARAFLDVLEFRIVDDDVPWEATAVAIETDIPGRFLRRTPGTGLAKDKPWIRRRALLTTTGPICVVVRLKRVERWPGADVRLARRVVELVRSTYANSPWSGLRGDAAAPAFIAALKDPHWGLRWRAARNLGRLPRETEGVEAAAVRALEDPDPSVRVAAIDAFRTWKAVDAIPVPILESLKVDDDREVLNHAWKAVEGRD